MSQKLKPVAVLVSVLVVAGLSFAQDRPEGRDICPECSLLCLDARHNGDTVHVRLGELVLVSLVGNPSTGANWHLVRAFEPGESYVELKYYRSWEGEPTATRSYGIHVVVH